MYVVNYQLVVVYLDMAVDNFVAIVVDVNIVFFFCVIVVYFVIIVADYDANVIF